MIKNIPKTTNLKSEPSREEYRKVVRKLESKKFRKYKKTKKLPQPLFRKGEDAREAWIADLPILLNKIDEIKGIFI